MGVDVGSSITTKSEPNVVPLCDILLVLLIIFMVITPVAQKGIDIQLPEQSGAGGPEKSGIVLTLERDLSLKINQEPITRDMLESRLKDLYIRRTDKTIFIRADKDVIYKDVLKIIDIAKGSGVEVLGVVTQTYETNPQ
ncbi:MAG: biopolymer transporter ExbD [Candidatus Aminicenantes bacterium]|nr:MAG: biopolymer transporter ExbD [Candidatus Aminicenantes bacterium]